VKTRLCPPCSAEQAAAIAEAALCDTLAAVAAPRPTGGSSRSPGSPGSWLAAGFTVVEQRGAGLAERLSHAVSLVPTGRLLIVGMDTPQCTPALLDAGFAGWRGCDAALGPATDGGYWALGLRAAYAGVFDRVPMSAAETGARQLARLRELGLRPSCSRR
jgi:glycosyltransferase A (GT-A) superfamily protein (DUF2064 family)